MKFYRLTDGLPFFFQDFEHKFSTPSLFVGCSVLRLSFLSIFTYRYVIV
jgi:hypothetical protein